MRQSLTAATAALLACAGASSAHAQGMDRYGGLTPYAPPPAAAAAPAAPARVLSWPGKSIPVPAAAPAASSAAPQPVYGGQPQPATYAPAQPPGPALAAYPSPYQPQPYYAPAPAQAAPAPGSTATAPSGVYPANTVPPQLAYPFAVPPQAAQPLVGGPAPPTSIYAPPPQAAIGRTAADPSPSPRVAMNTAAVPGQSARLYSLHRQFGLEPDPTPKPAADTDRQTVELVSSIDSGVGGEPPAETRNRVVQTNGKTGSAVLRTAGAARSDEN